MLSLDSVSDGILFQCDGCRYVGEVHVEGTFEEGSAYCWKCLRRMKTESERRKVVGSKPQFENGPCGRCGEVHGSIPVFVDENEQKTCMTCWLGKEPAGSRRRLILIET